MLSSKFPKLKEFLISNHWKNKPRFSTPLTSYTSFRCSSVAHYLLKVADIQELKKALAFCGIHKIPYFTFFLVLETLSGQQKNSGRKYKKLTG